MERQAWGRGLLTAALIFAVTAGCEVFEDIGDRFKTCEDTSIVLTNSQQTRVAVNIIGPEEVFAQENLLESGQSRNIVLCMDHGDRKLFQVRQGGEIVESVNCVASHDSYTGRPKPSVVWTQDDLLCENW
jgi:hypothetical protein